MTEIIFTLIGLLGATLGFLIKKNAEHGQKIVRLETEIDFLKNQKSDIKAQLARIYDEISQLKICVERLSK